MSMQIREIVLYSEDGKKRHLRFRLGSVNIITGRSGTGKSAIIPIIDYCLGRSTFTIPEGVIRDSVAWYAVILRIRPETEIFIAKPAPRASSTSQSQACVLSGSFVEAPEIGDLEINSNDEALEKLLSREIGISPNINEPGDGQSRDAIRATISHTKFLLFQEQGLIANRDLLFFRQSEQFIPQAIKDTLPYFLGAIEEDHLGLMEEARRLRREVKLLERELSERRSIGGSGLSTGRALFFEAVQNGLVAEGDVPQSQAELRSILRMAELWKPTVSSESVSYDLAAIRKEVSQLRSALRELSEAEDEARDFSHYTTSYADELVEQAARLESIGLLAEIEHDPLGCPFCGGHAGVLAPPARLLTERFRILSERLGAVAQQRPKLVQHLSSIQVKQAELRQKIRERQEDLLALEKANAKGEAEADRNAQVSRVIGRISLYLESAPTSDAVQELQQRISIKSSRLNEIDSLLAKGRKFDLLSSILNSLSSEMNRLASGLYFEHKEYALRFDLTNLTVVSDRPLNPFPMQRMGSGQNWLACHLLAMLALHSHFRANRRPVPGFIVLDQPSQVYFPSEEKYRDADGSVGKTVAAVNDITAVEAMFNLLFEFTQRRAGDFQILILEHANLADDRYQAALIEEVWDGESNALVPPSWV